MLSAQIPGVPGGPEILILFVLVVPPLVAAYLTYQTGKAAGDQHALLWAVVIALLTGFYVLPGIIALAAYSYSRAN